MSSTGYWMSWPGTRTAPAGLRTAPAATDGRHGRHRRRHGRGTAAARPRVRRVLEPPARHLPARHHCGTAVVNATRLRHLDEFYRLLDELARNENGPRRLKDCTGRDGWPRHGVYFFLENGETRQDGTRRVMRVGTHALRATDNTILWGRLRQHRGRVGGRNPGGGNHRASIFRGHVGAAFIRRDGRPGGLMESWASNHRHPECAVLEDQLERVVSEHIGTMPF